MEHSRGGSHGSAHNELIDWNGQLQHCGPNSGRYTLPALYPLHWPDITHLESPSPSASLFHSLVLLIFLHITRFHYLAHGNHGSSTLHHRLLRERDAVFSHIGMECVQFLLDALNFGRNYQPVYHGNAIIYFEASFLLFLACILSLIL